MADIAVVHWDLMRRGGAEAVSVNVMDALRDDHEVTLVTQKLPDFETLNAYFDTNVSGVAVRRPPELQIALERFSEVTDRWIGFQFGLLRESLLFRFARSVSDEFDLMISTRDECPFDSLSIQYVNYPRYGVLERGDPSTTPGFSLDNLSLPRSLYYRSCFSLAGFDVNDFNPERLLTNSEWTAKLIRDLYGRRPEIVYPPVDTEGFDGVPWADRENGFVSVGRVSPDKNILRNIEIIKRVRQRGHDVHLHVIGPAGDHDYFERVVGETSDHEYLHLDGAMTRDQLVSTLSRHRYGLHGKDNEHFGMSVAEFAAGGLIPFVPDSGGQRDIVRQRPEVTYDTVAEAVEKIERVISDPNLQSDLRSDIVETGSRFGRERFRDRIRDVVSEVVG